MSEGKADETTKIEHPSQTDVLLGRGSLHAWHPGNVSFLRRIDESVGPHEQAGSKSRKSQIIQEIYDDTLGRFLMRVPKTTYYEEVSEEVAREKIGQIMRYRKRLAHGAAPEETQEGAQAEEADEHNHGVGDLVPIEISEVGNAQSNQDVAVNLQSEEELFSDEELLSVLGWMLD